MKKIAAAAVALAIMLPAVASAEDTKEGWDLQFRQDTFDKVLFPLAMMTEEGDSFDKALIAFGCGADGQLSAFFQPERFMIFPDATKAQFRDNDSTKDFTFSVGDLPHMGKRLVIDADQSDELAQIFVAAAGSDVAFRTDKRQGVFTSVGAAETFKIVQAHCPNRSNAEGTSGPD